MLFISEPTLVRWERGEGGPRENHLQILRRLKEESEVDESFTYFDYDGRQDTVRARDVLKQQLIDAMEGMGARRSGEELSQEESTWRLLFRMGWEIEGTLSAVLACEGSYLPQRPCVDFALILTSEAAPPAQIIDTIREIFIDHRLLCLDSRSGMTVHHRLFDTACNKETILHVVRNFRSCWERIKGCFCTDGTPAAEGQANGKYAAAIEERVRAESCDSS